MAFNNESVLLVTHYGTSDGTAIVNTTCWARVDATGAPFTDAGTRVMTQKIAEAWRLQVVPQLSAGYTYDRTVGKEVLSWTTGAGGAKILQFGENWEDVIGSGIAGGVAGEHLPSLVAGTVALSSGFTSRSTKGRIRLGPLAESQSQGNSLTPAAQTAIGTAMGLYLAPFLSAPDVPGDVAPVVMSRKRLFSAASGTPPYDFSYFVTDYTVRAILGYLKSRKLRPAT